MYKPCDKFFGKKRERERGRKKERKRERQRERDREKEREREGGEKNKLVSLIFLKQSFIIRFQT